MNQEAGQKAGWAERLRPYLDALLAFYRGTGSVLAQKVSRRIVRILLSFTMGAVIALTVLQYVVLSNRLASRAERLSQLTALSASQPLWDFNTPALKQIVGALMLDGEITYAAILNEKGIAQVENGDTTRWTLLTVDRPVMRGQQRIGMVRIAFTPIQLVVEILLGIVIILLVAVVIGASLLALLGAALGELVHHPVETLMGSVRAIGQGNLDTQVSIRTGDEFEDLAGTMNTMLGQLREYRERLVVETRLVQEMELAQRIQTALLPRNLENPFFDIVASMTPADQVGGDYYDVIPTDDKLWFVIGDVSGHGITSGLISMMVQTAISTVLRRAPDALPLDLISVLNETITENLRRMGEDKYMTLTIFSCVDGQIVDFVGLHQDIYVYRADGRKVERIETEGLWIGLQHFPLNLAKILKPGSLRLNTGDVMVLYSDGVTEAANSDGEMYSDERLVQAIEQNAAAGSQALHDAIHTDLHAHMEKQDDDITLMVLRRL